MIKLCHPNIPILYGIVHETCSLVMSFHGSPSECSNLYNAVKNSFNQPFYPVYKGVFMGILRAVSSGTREYCTMILSRIILLFKACLITTL